MIKYLIIFLTTLAQLEASSFSLDKYEINIESNFLGEEIVIFGEKSSAHDLLIILEGKGEKVRLNEKVKKKYFGQINQQIMKIFQIIFQFFLYQKKQ